MNNRTTCFLKDCGEPLGEGDYAFCTFHRDELNAKIKRKEDQLIDYRIKDTCYMQYLTIFLKCSEGINVREDEENYYDNTEEMYWVKELLYKLLFEQYYKQKKCKKCIYLSDMNIVGDESRTQLLVELIKTLKIKCCGSMNSIDEMKDLLHFYQCSVIFLTTWVQEQKIIEKNLLVRELDLVDDLTKQMIENIVKKL